MAKRRKKTHSRRSLSSGHTSTRKKTHTRRRRRTGMRDGKLTGNQFLDGAAGVAAAIGAKFLINMLPLDDIKNKTKKGLDDPMTKKALAAAAGVALGYMMKNKPMMIGAGAVGVVMIAQEKFPELMADDGDFMYVNPNLLNLNDSPVMYLSDNDGNTYGVNDQGQVMNLADGAQGWTVFPGQ